MKRYIIKRLLLIIPTVLAILLLNFTIVQWAPGGPVDQVIAKFKNGGEGDVVGAQLGGETASIAGAGQKYDRRVANPDLVDELNRQFGFDKPAHVRFMKMVTDYLRFDFGKSFFKNQRVTDLIVSKLPVSLSLGFWTTLIVYLVAIPLGIRKALHDHSRFDMWTSIAISIGYAIPTFALALGLIIFFAGGNFFTWFPLRGLISDNWADLSLWGKLKDYIWHMVLPVTALVVGEFARLTMLTKNSFLEEINKTYVLAARAKGLPSRRILYHHIFRNAMIVVMTSLPQALISVFLTGSLLIEVLFSLDGLGLLAFESALTRDYPVLFGTLYIYTLIGLGAQLISDLLYPVIDPRIDLTRKMQ